MSLLGHNDPVLMHTCKRPLALSVKGHADLEATIWANHTMHNAAAAMS